MAPKKKPAKPIPIAYALGMEYSLSGVLYRVAYINQGMAFLTKKGDCVVSQKLDAFGRCAKTGEAAVSWKAEVCS